ncbi:hypothetical protein B0H14DRAFT_3134327 [Mycena olivaceomarginata]|nr:hypothetical protein B0H14DRAFT_3134327 [Mycena olivaceomarginata]
MFPPSGRKLPRFSIWFISRVLTRVDQENAGANSGFGTAWVGSRGPNPQNPQIPEAEHGTENRNIDCVSGRISRHNGYPLTALKWGEGSLIRVLWDERLEKPVITTQTACECDDIAVLAIYSQLAKPEILHQNQTLEGLIQATTALFTEIWKSAPVLNLDGIRGSMVRREIEGHVMGSPGIRGFGIVVSVPLLAGEYIYELTGLLSVDGNAEHTRLSEIRAADNTVRILFGPLRMLNHDCNPNAEYESITGCELGLIVRTLRSVESGEEITLRYSSDYFDDAGQCPCRTCRPPEPQRLGPSSHQQGRSEKSKTVKKTTAK